MVFKISIYPPPTTSLMPGAVWQPISLLLFFGWSSGRRNQNICRPISISCGHFNPSVTTAKTSLVLVVAFLLFLFSIFTPTIEMVHPSRLIMGKYYHSAIITITSESKKKYLRQPLSSHHLTTYISSRFMQSTQRRVFVSSFPSTLSSFSCDISSRRLFSTTSLYSSPVTSVFSETIQAHSLKTLTMIGAYSGLVFNSTGGVEGPRTLACGEVPHVLRLKVNIYACIE